SLDAGGRGRMVAVGVGDEDVRDRLVSYRREQRRNVRLVERARIDDGNAAVADDVAYRALEGERPRVVAQEPTHARAHLLDLTGRELEASVVADVIAHRTSTWSPERAPSMEFGAFWPPPF